MGSRSKEVMEFARFFAKVRAENFKSLRDFCSRTQLDPIWINKLEEGLAPAPDPEDAVTLAGQLSLREGTSQFTEFLVLANKARTAYAAKPLSEEELFKKLPVAFRGLRVGQGEDAIDVLDQSKKIAQEIHTPEHK